MTNVAPSASLFPLSSKYSEAWIRKNSLGEDVLYNLESLLRVMNLQAGMRVLDLGCGRAISSIFLAREFGAVVWAVDAHEPPSENLGRIIDQECGATVFPLQADARNLPFAHGYFDAIVVVNSYHYFGTDETFTPYISQFLAPGGLIGIVDVCFTREINTLAELPANLREEYADSWYFVHSVPWWHHCWEKSGHLKVITAEILPENDFIRANYVACMPSERKRDAIAKAIGMDDDNVIAFFRLVARLKE